MHSWKAHEICYKTLWQYQPYLLHVATLPREIKNQIFCRCGKKRKQVAFLIASNFVIHAQIRIFSVFKIASLFPCWLQIKLSMSLFFLLVYFCDQFVAPKIRHSRRQQWTWYSATRTRFWYKKNCIWRGTQQRGWQTNLLEKAGQSVVLISCWKTCGTRNSWQATTARAADRAVKRN